MSPTPHTAQAERNEVKSKPAPLRLRRLRGYAQGERESKQGYTQVKIALEWRAVNKVYLTGDGDSYHASCAAEMAFVAARLGRSLFQGDRPELLQSVNEYYASLQQGQEY
jgi:hypothetical protein